jgi:hypothetical protein
MAGSYATGAPVSGNAKDPSGAAVAQAVVALQSAQASFSTATDQRGHFLFSDVPADEYRLSQSWVVRPQSLVT